MTASREFLCSDLPVAGVLSQVREASRSGAVVVTAPPGSGKTMLVPAAVLDDLADGMKLILLQPRRIAARAVAQQIAILRGVPLGGEVGYQVRFDSCTSRDTRLFVETTGIMLRRLLTDISLEGIGAVVLDEFHERTIEMDLVLGMLVRIASTLRPDLRIVVMSATLATEPVLKLLGNCPLVSAEGRRYPVDIRYARRGDSRSQNDLVVEAVLDALEKTDGHLLVFLPGVGEILKCEQLLAPIAERKGHLLLTLFGDLPPEQQDRVLVEGGSRKIILSTNVAETSLTIFGITAVIDSGLARQMQVSPATGLPQLQRISISKASADQRAGRAGRTGPGRCYRLWDEASHVHRVNAQTPEVLRSDLAEPLLQLSVLGEGDDFPWLDVPPRDAVENGRRLLVMLGAIDENKCITPLGHELARIPAHPRLGRLLLAGARHGVLRETSVAAAMLSERDPFRWGTHVHSGPRDRVIVRSRSDVVDRVIALQAFHAGVSQSDKGLELHPGGARNILRAAEQLYRVVDGALAPRAQDPASSLMQALLEAFPDRLARLRSGTQDRATMVGGRGVRLDHASRVRQEPFFLAIEINDAGGEASVRQASAIEKKWIDAEAINLRSIEELLYHPTRRQVEARLRTYWADLVIDETPRTITDSVAAAKILEIEARAQFDRVVPSTMSAAGSFRSRVRWLASVAPDLELPTLDDADVASMLPELCRGLRSLDDVQSADWLASMQAAVGFERLDEIDRLAPVQIQFFNGKRHTLIYEHGKTPVLAVRIQELFGVCDTPCINGGRVTVLLHLLGPNHRPQQVTSDLQSFWKNTYPTVQKELRRKYPKHSWPDDPLAPLPSREEKRKKR